MVCGLLRSFLIISRIKAPKLFTPLEWCESFIDTFQLDVSINVEKIRTAIIWVTRAETMVTSHPIKLHMCEARSAVGVGIEV